MDAGTPPRRPAANPSYNPYAQPPVGASYNTPFNPYAHQPAQNAEAQIYAPAGTGGAVSAGVIAELEGTKGWVRFLGIMSFILTIIVVIAAIGVALSAGAGGGTAGRVAALAMALLYVLIAFLMLFPARRMIAYAAKITNLMQSRSSADLEDALSEQRRLWRFYGIIGAIYLVLVGVGMVAAILIPALSGSR